jgi:hypothetical protein
MSVYRKGASGLKKTAGNLVQRINNRILTTTHTVVDNKDYYTIDVTAKKYILSLTDLTEFLLYFDAANETDTVYIVYEGKTLLLKRSDGDSIAIGALFRRLNVYTIDTATNEIWMDSLLQPTPDSFRGTFTYALNTWVAGDISTPLLNQTAVAMDTNMTYLYDGAAWNETGLIDDPNTGEVVEPLNGWYWMVSVFPDYDDGAGKIVWNGGRDDWDIFLENTSRPDEYTLVTDPGTNKFSVNIIGLLEKTVPNAADILSFADSEDSNILKRITLSNLLTAAGGSTGMWIDEAVLPSGSGASGTPYIITNAKELAWVAKQVNVDQAAGWSENTYFTLQNDISLLFKEWTPIGTSAKPFKGIFTQQTAMIVNGLTIIGTDVTSDVGLFGNVGASSVKTKLPIIHFKNVYINVENQYGASDVGALVGETNEYFLFEASAPDIYTVEGVILGGSNVGGLVGKHTNGQVMNAHNKAYVRGNNTSVGGVVGSVSGSTSDCINEGTIINRTRTGLSYKGFVGGIAGTGDNISNCTNLGRVHGEGSYFTGVGGIVGYCGAHTILNCSNHGDVSLEGTGATKIGGLIGYTSSSSSVIENSYSVGVITSTVTTAYGLDGTNIATITNSFYLDYTVNGGSENTTQTKTLGELTTVVTDASWSTVVWTESVKLTGFNFPLQTAFLNIGLVQSPYIEARFSAYNKKEVLCNLVVDVSASAPFLITPADTYVNIDNPMHLIYNSGEFSYNDTTKEITYSGREKRIVHADASMTMEAASSSNQIITATWVVNGVEIDEDFIAKRKMGNPDDVGNFTGVGVGLIYPGDTMKVMIKSTAPITTNFYMSFRVIAK